ncbi:hypothetical protein HPG69_018299 [Diceros bicornis minor]|uniref:Sulfotransferase n=1 Tax=Diceros bicornis minor TaxID=77932 RepID=A0A7J7ERR0_DICBM|nr:hypothetical protein HPG69_018299 [Diceros bicornis minor]
MPQPTTGPTAETLTQDEYLWYEGIHFPILGFIPELLREAWETFVFKDEDVLILTYPKSGTNWLVIYLIRNPRDVLVSGYFYWRMLSFIKKPESQEEYFEWFIQGYGETQEAL